MRIRRRLVLQFYTGKQFPAAYRGALFISLRLEQQSRAKIGYSVARVQQPSPSDWKILPGVG
ncbi:MAG: hypothetical protein U0Y68_20520 [Blastocatellia bacterium]